MVLMSEVLGELYNDTTVDDDTVVKQFGIHEELARMKITKIKTMAIMMMTISGT